MIESRLIVQILLSLAALLGTIISIRLMKRVVDRIGKRQNMHEQRFFYVNKIITILFIILFLLLISIIWGFDIEGLPIFFASFFGLVGIAFFASWSVLSNVTASLIIFFNYRLRIADKIKIIDGDNSITGQVKDMTLFTVVIENEHGDILTYPNNLFIQKPIQKMPEA